ncbi:MAG: helix-turn-helix domain-containing protein [Acidimicrobiales bacterium]
MRRTRFDHDPCPMARTADLLGDWWTPLVLRELLLGCRRFSDLQTRLGINRSLLTERLRRLESEGIVVRRRYRDHPPRNEYEPTDKGRALWDVLAVMWSYGNQWLFDESAEIDLVDKHTGRPIRPAVIDASTGAALDPVTTRRRPVGVPVGAASVIVTGEPC